LNLVYQGFGRSSIEYNYCLTMHYQTISMKL